MVEVSLTVGKLDASLALLLTKDHHLIEFPTILLPDGVQAGLIIKIKCDRDLELEKEQQEKFNQVQDSILELYGKQEPEPPLLKVKNITQTSCVLEWEKLQLANASIKSLSLYKNNVRLGQIPNALVNTTTKLSGLPLDTSFKFRLRLDTTSGVYYSNELEIKTHKMTDLSGITICLGEINYEEEGYTEEDIKVLLSNIGGKPIQKEVQVDTTHFICTLAKGPQWKRAVDNNIPVVRPEWLKACMQEKRLAGVRIFYLDANLEMIKKYRIVVNEPLINKRKSMLIKEQQEQYDEVSLEQTPKVPHTSVSALNEPSPSALIESKEPDVKISSSENDAPETQKKQTEPPKKEAEIVEKTEEATPENVKDSEKDFKTVVNESSKAIDEATASETEIKQETTEDPEQIKKESTEVAKEVESKVAKEQAESVNSEKENSLKAVEIEGKQTSSSDENQEAHVTGEENKDKEIPDGDVKLEQKKNDESSQISKSQAIKEDINEKEPNSVNEETQAQDSKAEESANNSEITQEKINHIGGQDSDEPKATNEKVSEDSA